MTMSSSPSPAPIDVGSVGLGLAPPPHAATTRATTPSAPRNLRFFMLPPPVDPRLDRPPLAELPVPDGQVVLAPPREPDLPALRFERLHRRGREVLLRDDELPARVQRHDIARIRPQVDHVADRAKGRELVRPGCRVGIDEPDLLGPDGVGA